MKVIYKQTINQRDIKSSEKVVLCSDCTTGVCSWRNDADFKCTSHWEGASHHQADPQSSGQVGKVSYDLLPEVRSHNRSGSVLKCVTKNTEFYGFLRQPWHERTLSSENKTFKPAITLTRFPVFFVKALPKCPEAYQIWIWLHRLEWASNQSTAVSSSNLGLHPAWALSVQALCTPTHAVHGTTCAPIQRYGWWHIFAIRKFNVWFVAFGDFLINLKRNINNRRNFRGTFIFSLLFLQTESHPILYFFRVRSCQGVQINAENHDSLPLKTQNSCGCMEPLLATPCSLKQIISLNTRVSV